MKKFHEKINGAIDHYLYILHNYLILKNILTPLQKVIMKNRYNLLEANLHNSDRWP